MNYYNTIEPLNFRYYCQKVLPAVYDESLSYYELLCKLVAKINQIIAVDNTQNEGLKQLTDFVNHYFDNLNVQTQLNNKLDAMAQSGQLAQIIAEFLDTINLFGFTTTSALKNGSNFVDGMYCRTLGNTDYKSGDGSFFYIRTKTQQDIPDEQSIFALNNYDNLIAEKIPNADLTEITNTVAQLQNGLTNLENTIGDLTTLTTDHKDNIVNAINDNAGSIQTQSSTLSQITDTTIPTINSKIGNLSDLATNHKDSIVESINEVKSQKIPISQGGTGATNKTDARSNLEVMTAHILFDSDDNPTNDDIDFSSKLNEYGTELNDYKYLEFFYCMNIDEGRFDDGISSAKIYNNPDSAYFNNNINLTTTASTRTEVGDNKTYFKISHARYDVGTPTDEDSAILVTTDGKTGTLSFEYPNSNPSNVTRSFTIGSSNIYVFRVVGYF